MPFRTKLIAVVSVPLFALIGFAEVLVYNRYHALTEEQQYGHVVNAFSALARLGPAVAAEGVGSGYYVAEPLGDPPASKALIFDTRNATDSAVTALDGSLGSLPGHVSAKTLALVDQVVTGTQILQVGAKGQGGVRAKVDLFENPGDTFFTNLANESMVAANSVARDISDRSLSTSLLGIVNLRQGEVAAATEASIVTNWYLGHPGDVASWDAAVHDQTLAQQSFQQTATPAEAAAEAKAAGPPPPDPLRSTAAGVLPTAFHARPPVDVYTYFESVLAKQASVDNGVNAVQAVVDRTAVANEANARNLLVLAAGGTALLVALVLALAWLLVQAVNKPLRALIRAARNVAERRLPQLVDTVRAGGQVPPDLLDRLAPVRVESKDEIGELAKQFGDIQQVAVSVAEEQAALLREGIGDLYVNLARRNQSLLDRQLGLLDDLERDAGDPDELATLFELDHLSTRMRRNAESLLVLSGSPQPRQWRTAIPVIDVVRAAAAEIADFARVTNIGLRADLAVAGHTVADVTHLLAELLENATAFSPPTTAVIVAGGPSEHRYVLSVTDQGIGIDDERLAKLNELLAQPPPAGLALSRTLGLHVVAYLAARHGIYVQLRRNDPVGVVAVVALPPAILAPAGPTETEATNGDGGGERPVVEPPPLAARAEPVEVHRGDSWTPPPAPVIVEPIPMPAARPDAPTPAAPSYAETPIRFVAPERHATLDDEAPDEDDLPQRVVRAVPGPADEGLTTRVPGTHLSHRPSPTRPSGGEARPRPERVHDLLTRHSRGVHEGQGREDE
ncbi:MAG TPA: ATP-binding protein [Acidimicrobiia bacterium]